MSRRPPRDTLNLLRLIGVIRGLHNVARALRALAAGTKRVQSGTMRPLRSAFLSGTIRGVCGRSLTPQPRVCDLWSSRASSDIARHSCPMAGPSHLPEKPDTINYRQNKTAPTIHRIGESSSRGGPGGLLPDNVLASPLVLRSMKLK
ncbi:unnamed protein product, partial [Iphiclides podalirius]